MLSAGDRGSLMQIKLSGESSATEVGNFFQRALATDRFPETTHAPTSTRDDVTLQSLTQSHVSGLLNSND
jgi:hypothetical protein